MEKKILIDKKIIIIMLIIIIIALGIGLYFAFSKITEEKDGLNQDQQDLINTQQDLTDRWNNLGK